MLRKGWDRPKLSSRYVATSSAGTESTRRAHRRTTSSVASSAQCKSSTTTTDGVDRSSSSISARATSYGWPPASTRCLSPPSVTRAMSSSGPNGRGVNSASHVAHNTRTDPAICAQNWRTSVVLPIPASPCTSTSSPERRRATSLSAATNLASCSCTLQQLGRVNVKHRPRSPHTDMILAGPHERKRRPGSSRRPEPADAWRRCTLAPRAGALTPQRHRPTRARPASRASP